MQYTICSLVCGDEMYTNADL